MFRKPVKFGVILVREEVITREQVTTVLEAQKTTNKAFGRLVSELFSVPEELIESLYVSEVLEPSIKWFLFQNLNTIFASKSIELIEIIKDIEVTVLEFSRHLSVTTSFAQDTASPYRFSLVEGTCRFEQISGTIGKLEVTLKSADSSLLFSIVPFTFALNTQALVFSNPGFMSEIRIKIMQAMKLRKE